MPKRSGKMDKVKERTEKELEELAQECRNVRLFPRCKE